MIVSIIFLTIAVFIFIMMLYIIFFNGCIEDDDGDDFKELPIVAPNNTLAMDCIDNKNDLLKENRRSLEVFV